MPSLAYDSKGNLAGIGSSGYEYTSENRLATTSNGNYLGYGPLDGQLLQVKPGATDTRFHWAFDGRSGGSELLMEIDGFTGATLRRYVHGPSTGSGGTDEPILAYEGSGLSNKRYLTADERGSIVAVSDGSGNVVATNSYDEYGNPGSGNATIANGGRFGYTGQAWLPELQMWYYKARIFNPALGRFMQTDPIGYGDGMNWYDYVGGDPVNKVDPSGLECSAIYESKYYKNSQGVQASEKKYNLGNYICDAGGSGGFAFGSGSGGGGYSDGGDAPEAIVVNGLRTIASSGQRYQGPSFCPNATVGALNKFNPLGRINSGKQGGANTAMDDLAALSYANLIPSLDQTLTTKRVFQAGLSSPIPLHLGNGWFISTNAFSGFTSVYNTGLTIRFKRTTGDVRIDIPAGFELPSGLYLQQNETCHYNR